MAPLEGATLGQRHRHYNELLAKALKTNTKDIPSINYDDDDVDNMIRIDIACHNRNVDYILEVFKCDDMFYVTRALKYSTWLITEDQYSHIINPEYLHNNLFPEMIAKAISRLMLHIRRYLKDEIRLDNFYTYINERNPKQALKWLPNCSTILIEEMVSKRTKEMNLSLIKRIGRRSENILKQMVKITGEYDASTSFQQSLLLLRSHVDDFLDVIESKIKKNDNHYGIPTFTPKTTAVVMKYRPKIIINDFHIYSHFVHLPTFAKFIRKENTKDFLLTKFDNIIYNLHFDTFKLFANNIPRDNVLDFLKELFRTGNGFKADGDNRSEAEALFTTIEYNNKDFKNVYRWYEFAPLDVAFPDLKKFIYAESSPEERHSMLIKLLKCCGKNLNQGKIVIKYYHKRHINEPYLHKITFVNAVLDQYDVFRFDDDLWNTVNELFHSLEVYIESKNKVQKCLQNIIIYKALRNDAVPEIVEQKFKFNSLKCYENKIDNDEIEKVFQYLYKDLLTKLDNQTLKSETSMGEAVSLLSDLWTLIQDWKKQDMCYKFVINKAVELCDINKTNTWDIDMRHLYKMLRPYQKPLLEKSILLHQHEDVILNILLHNVELLEQNKHTVVNLCCSDKISLRRVLRKLRIYWTESLRTEWASNFKIHLEKTAGHKTFVQGIFILSRHSEAMDFIKEFVPSEDKIKWSEDKEVTISLRKHIAKSMHLSRPQLPAETVLLYAKGDYMQYTVFSLHSIYYNLRSNDMEQQIHKLLNAPVSLQKHGIRLACKKLKPEKFVTICQNIWKSTKNSTIRATIFQLLFNILCKENSLVDLIWDVLRSFIDDLKQDENMHVYETLGCHIDNVPITIVRDFYEKSFILLKSLLHKPECESHFDTLIRSAPKIFEYLDGDFLEKSILGFKGIHVILENHNENSVYNEILALHLLYSTDEKQQMQKYKNLIAPVLEECGPKWVDDCERSVVDGLGNFLTNIGHRLDFVFRTESVIPVKMMQTIEQTIRKYLPDPEFHSTLMEWKLSVGFTKLYDEFNSKPGTRFSWDEMRNKLIEPFAQICAEYLKDDVKENFPSIHILFSKSIKEMSQRFGIIGWNYLNLLYSMLDCKDLYVFLTVLNLVPEYYIWRDEEQIMVGNICIRLYEFKCEEFKYHYFLKYSIKYNSNDESEPDHDEAEPDQDDKDE